MIQKHVQDRLAELILDGKVKDGDKVVVVEREGSLDIAAEVAKSDVAA